MDYMFWVWLGVIVLTAVIEFATMEIVSIWFTFGAIIPFIMAASNSVRWEIQVVVFVVVSALLIVSLRAITKKFLLKNSNEKTNLDSIIGKQYRMLERTDFETMGSLKINDVTWSAIAENQKTIEKGEIVEIVKVDGNKLIVKKISDEPLQEKEEAVLQKKNPKKVKSTEKTEEDTKSSKEKNIKKEKEEPEKSKSKKKKGENK